MTARPPWAECVGPARAAGASEAEVVLALRPLGGLRAVLCALSDCARYTIDRADAGCPAAIAVCALAQRRLLDALER